MDPLTELIIRHEGLKLHPYRDTNGYLTIGVGRNLDTSGISADEAYALLDHDITRCQLELLPYLWYSNLDETRRGVIVELTFNVGLTKVLEFKKMITALKLLDFKTASKELGESTWATQVGVNRATNMSARLLTGKYY